MFSPDLLLLIGELGELLSFLNVARLANTLRFGESLSNLVV